MDKTITALEPQKKNPERINVYLDDQFAFGISRFVGAWLKQGEKLDDARIQELVAADQREQALQRALHFIAYRPRSEKEVVDKLAAADIEETIIADVLQELKEKNYLDDKRFAQDWIESRSSSKPRSYRFYSYELKRKGISEEKIDQALEAAPPEEDLAYQLGRKYMQRYAALTPDEFKKKMQGVLARRAFSYDVIRQTINKLNLERKMEESE
ncbi:MAG: regulatory protein [Chloroflexota bacterium]|nr:regulatory protein [Chloroflexota bacterium]